MAVERETMIDPFAAAPSKLRQYHPRDWIPGGLEQGFYWVDLYYSSGLFTYARRAWRPNTGPGWIIGSWRRWRYRRRHQGVVASPS